MECSQQQQIVAVHARQLTRSSTCSASLSSLLVSPAKRACPPRSSRLRTPAGEGGQPFPREVDLRWPNAGLHVRAATPRQGRSTALYWASVLSSSDQCVSKQRLVRTFCSDKARIRSSKRRQATFPPPTVPACKLSRWLSLRRLRRDVTSRRGALKLTQITRTSYVCNAYNFQQSLLQRGQQNLVRRLPVNVATNLLKSVRLQPVNKGGGGGMKWRDW